MRVAAGESEIFSLSPTKKSNRHHF